jgi:sugar lactone lactonase YvrE
MARRLNVAVECVVDARNTTGESPLWSAREAALYWVDIPDGWIYRLHPATGEQRKWQMPAAVGSIGLREQGGLVAALRTGFHLFDPETGTLTFLCHPEPDIATNRLNDGKVSPEGRFWVGTMDERPQKEPVGSLYRLDADHRCTRMAGDVKVSNGLAWSPDGGATDEEACYWSCGVSGGRINRFSPSGELIEYVEVPVTHPTMPCFGGPDRRTLYFTSLRENLSDAELVRTPLAGGVFMLEPGVAGAPAALYKG